MLLELAILFRNFGFGLPLGPQHNLIRFMVSSDKRSSRSGCGVSICQVADLIADGFNTKELANTW